MEKWLYWLLPQPLSGQKRTLSEGIMSSVSGRIITSGVASLHHNLWHIFIIIIFQNWFKLFRFEAKGGASVKQQDAKRQKMANGVVKKKKKPNKQEASKRDLKNILKTCKANGLSLGEITEIVSETFWTKPNGLVLFQIIQNFWSKLHYIINLIFTKHFVHNLNLNSLFSDFHVIDMYFSRIDLWIDNVNWISDLYFDT